MRSVKRNGLVPPAYDRDAFAIPSFARRLSKFSDRLENGPGFFLLRGIPIENHDLETIKLMY